MTTTHTRALTAAAALLAAGLALTACDPEQPDPAPTETTTEPTEEPTTAEPTEEPSLSYQDQQIQAAEEFVLDYYDASNSLGQNGYEYEDIDAMFNYFSGNLELWQQRSDGYEVSRENGESQEGGTEVVSIVAEDWTEDPTGDGFDTVTFRLCLDSRTTRVITADGDELDWRPPDHQYPAEIEVMGQPETELGWSLMEIETDGEASC